MSKKWYSYFVVSDEPPAPSDTSSEGDRATATQQRVSDMVPDTAPDGIAVPADATPVELDTVYEAAKIGAPAHGYTVLKVAEMLQSEHIRALPDDVKRKSVMVALDAAGIKVTDIVEDAVRRDRALDTYERVLQKSLDELRAKTAADNQQIEEEIAQRVSELRARIDANNRKMRVEQDGFAAWQIRKRQEEDTIAKAVSYFVSENPISTTRVVNDQGGADAG